MPVARVRSASRSTVAAAASTVLAAGRRLDELDHRPSDEGEVVVRTRGVGGGVRGAVVAESVAEQRGRVLGPGEGPALAPGGRVPQAELDEPRVSASRPRQAVSTMVEYMRGGAVPIDVVIASASSIRASAPAKSPACTRVPAR